MNFLNNSKEEEAKKLTKITFKENSVKDPKHNSLHIENLKNILNKIDRIRLRNK